MFGEIYKRYYQKVYYTCLGVVKDRDTAFDMVQDVMIKIMEKLPMLQNDFLLGLWVNRIAKNHSLDYLKQGKKQQTLEVTDQYDVAYISEQEEIIAKEQQFTQMEIAIANLSTEDQELIDLKYTKGLSIQELQDKYGLSKSAIKMRLLRTRQRIATAMRAKIVMN